MITFDGNLVYTFSLGDVTDFISVENLKSFRLFESAGNLRPIVHLEFELEDDRLVKYLNAGNILTISFGVTEIKKQTLLFELYSDNSNINRNLGYNTLIKAALYLPNFTSKVGCEYFPSSTSLQVFQKIAQKNKFNLITNISKTNDKQDWYRLGQTQWSFLKELWYSSYINENTFTSFAFDTENFYFYDMKELSKKPAKWTFSSLQTGSDTSEIVNIGGYTVKNNFGNLVELAGKNLINKVYNIDTGKIETADYNLKNFTTINSNKLNINNLDCSDYDYFIISDDVHANYVKARNQNIRNNLLYSTFNIYTQTASQLKKIKLLDTVKFEIEPKDERLEGIAYVTGIVYEYTGNLKINLTLNKESPSGIKGENLKEGD